MTADRPLLGILLMTGFCILAPLGDSIAKYLGGAVPVLQLVALRFAVQAAVLIPLVWASGRSFAMAPKYLVLAALRTVLHIVGIGAMFLSLRYLPLADAIAIAFVMPFIMLLLGRWVLGEEVGIRRLGACAVGFAGTLMVVQPSFAAVGAPALLPLLVALVFALFMLVTRQIAKATEPVALQAVSGAMACALFAPLFLLGGMLDWTVFAPVAPTSFEWLLLITLGLLGTAAHLLMTWSLRFAPASTLAPMQYLEIPVATAIGWLVFRDFPNNLAFAGILLTVAAGLYVIARERAVSRAAAPAPLA